MTADNYSYDEDLPHPARNMGCFNFSSLLKLNDLLWAEISRTIHPQQTKEQINCSILDIPSIWQETSGQ